MNRTRTHLVGHLDLRDLGVRARREDLDQAVLVGARSGHRATALLHSTSTHPEFYKYASSSLRAKEFTGRHRNQNKSPQSAKAGTLASNSAGESSSETIACSKLPLSSFLIRSIRSCAGK